MAVSVSPSWANVGQTTAPPPPTQGWGAITTPPPVNPVSTGPAAYGTNTPQTWKTPTNSFWDPNAVNNAVGNAKWNALSPADQAVQRAMADHRNEPGFMDTWFPAIVLAAASGGIGAGVGAAAGGGLAGAAAGGAAAGATTAVGNNIYAGKPFSTGGLAKGIAIGGATGALAYGANSTGIGSAIGKGTGVGTTVGNGIVKTGVGAAIGGLKGGGTGAVTGGLTAAGGAIGGAAGGSLGATVGGQIGKAVGGIVAPSTGGNGMTTPTKSTIGGGGTSGSSLFGGFSNSDIAGGLGFLGQAGMGAAVAGKQSNLETNAYTTAGRGANQTPVGVNGPGGFGAQFKDGQFNMNPGAMGPAYGNFSQFAGNSAGMANKYAGGYMPSQTQYGFDNFNQMNGAAESGAMAGRGSSIGVMNRGADMLGSANGNYQTAYDRALKAGQAALDPQIQQQSNALLNSNFAKGMAGSSGGALQTQALQNSFNQAELQNQQNAFGQGNTAFNSTISAGLGMFGSGATGAGNFDSQLSGFGQNSFAAGQQYNAFGGQMAGMWGNNANSGVQGWNGINHDMMAAGSLGANTGLGMGRNMIGAGQVQGGIGQGWNGGMMGAGSTIAGAFGQMLTGGNGGMMSGIGGGIANWLNGFGKNGSPDYSSPTYSGDPTGSYGGNGGTVPDWTGNDSAGSYAYDPNTTANTGPA